MFFYAGSHDSCLLAVLNNQSDVCGMSSRNFEARLEDGTFEKEDVKIIHKSDRVPPPPLAYSKMIPKEDRDKIKKLSWMLITMERLVDMVEKCLITWKLKILTTMF